MTPAWKCQELLNVWVLLHGWAYWHQSLKSICFVYIRAGTFLKTNFLKSFSGKVQKYLCWIFIAFICCHLIVLLYFFFFFYFISLSMKYSLEILANTHKIIQQKRLVNTRKNGRLGWNSISFSSLIFILYII